MKTFKFSFNTRFYIDFQARSLGEAWDKFNKYFPNANNVTVK